MEPTRLLLVDMPRVLEDIVRAAFADDPAFEFVTEGSTEPGDVAAAIAREGAGFVILWGSKPESPAVFRGLLEERPLTKMLALAGDGRENFLYVPLGEVDVPPVLEHIIRAFGGEPVFALVTDGSTEPVDVAGAMAREGAGVAIVWGSEPEPPEVFRGLLRERPRNKVLAVARDGRENFLCVPLGELTPQGLAEAVRSSAAGGGGAG